MRRCKDATRGVSGTYICALNQDWWIWMHVVGCSQQQNLSIPFNFFDLKKRGRGHWPLWTPELLNGYWFIQKWILFRYDIFLIISDTDLRFRHWLHQQALTLIISNDSTKFDKISLTWAIFATGSRGRLQKCFFFFFWRGMGLFLCIITVTTNWVWLVAFSSWSCWK